MINGERCLGVIAARGGSKRLSEKNIKNIAGKPLIEWTIEAGLEARSIDKLIVSTDDISIARLSECSGASVPFLRPEYLATDQSSSYEVLEHAVKFMRDLDEEFKYVMLLQPTSPLRNSRHIEEAAMLLQRKNADGIISVTSINHPIEWSGVIDDSLYMEKFINKMMINTQSQMFVERYCLNGAIYLTDIERMKKEKSHIYGKGMFAYIMDRKDSIDIDTQLDFDIAEYLLHKEHPYK